MAEELISVASAAERLGLSAASVRNHVASGALAGRHYGRMWLVDPDSVERFDRSRPPRGRPLAPAMAWAILLAASGEADAARAAVDRDRYWRRAGAWLQSHALADQAPRLRRRALVARYRVHPSELRRIVGRPDVVKTGISAAAEAVGLVGGGDEVEVYAPEDRRSAIVDAHALEPGDGQLVIRWVPAELWPVIDADGDGVAPRAAVLLDLLESADPRARREARRALARGV